MSNWSHVAGIVRIDWLRFSDEDGIDSDMLERLFGKSFGFGSFPEEAETHPEKFLPFGSEGSLDISLWENPDKHCLAAYTVSVFGDLRDHDDPDAIIDWFKEKCTNGNVWVRNACITVVNERVGTRNWFLKEDK